MLGKSTASGTTSTALPRLEKQGSGHTEGGQQGWGRGWEAGWEQVGSMKGSPWTGKGISLLWVLGPLSRGDGDLGKALL